MKLNVFMLVIALIVGGLIFYGLFSYSDRILLSSGSAVLCGAALLMSFGVEIVDRPRSTTMFRVLGGLLFLAFLIVDLLCLWLAASDAKFIILNGIIGVIGAIGLYLVYNSKQ